MQRSTYPPERRGFGRRESRIHAVARVPGRSAEPCIVLNFSAGGALLAFQTKIELPQRFRLVVEAKGIDAICEVRRRDGTEVGVSFVESGKIETDLEAVSSISMLLSSKDIPEEPPPPVVAAPKLSIDGPPVLVARGEDVRRMWSAEHT